MKTLFIVRHAKSSWDYPGIPDYERPLLEAGKLKTIKMAGYLIEQGVNPDLIMSSNAIRARETAAIIAQGLSYPVEKIQILPVIYQGNEEDVINILLEIPNENESVIIVGHNPTLTSLANYFLQEPIDWMPTSGVVCIEFITDLWKNILKAEKRTKFVVSPKQISGGKRKRK